MKPYISSNTLLLLCILCVLIACQQTHPSPPSTNSGQAFHPMVDGRNTEYHRLPIEPISISPDVDLFIFQNESYVWISYDYPEGSFGTLDMSIESPKLEAPLHIHVSAQLGEWPEGNEDLRPKTATSDLWWNMDGWTANNLWVNGIDTISYDTPEFKIKNGEIRELQLSKDRFGIGEWKVKLKINAIKGADGQFYSINFPEEEGYHVIKVSG